MAGLHGWNRVGKESGSGRRWTCFLLCALAFSAVMPSIKKQPGETPVYAKAAQRMLDGEQFYRPDEGKAFTYPPFFAVPYAPLSVLPQRVARSLWYFWNITLLAFVCVALIRVVRPIVTEGRILQRPGGRWMLPMIVLLSARFVISPIEYQSHDLIVFALVAAAMIYWDRSEGRVSGLCVGLATACKATPLLFLPLLLVQRRFGAVVVFTAAVCLATLLPDFLFPQASGELWVTSWYRAFVSKVSVGATAEAEGAWEPWNFLNQSLAGTVYRLFTPVADNTRLKFDVSLAGLSGTQLKLLTTSLQASVLALLAFGCWPGRQRGLNKRELAFRRLGEFSAVLCGMLLLSPMSSKQHFCVLVFPITYCTVSFFRGRRNWLVGGSLACVLLFGTLAAKDIVGRPLGELLLAYGSMSFCAATLLLASVRVLVVSSQAQQERSGQSDGVSPKFAPVDIIGEAA